MANELTVTTSRKDLIDLLETKKGELQTQWAEKFLELEREIAELPATTEAIKDWYILIANRLFTGTIRVNAKGEFTSLDDNEVPDKPTKNTVARSKNEIKLTIDNGKHERQTQFAQIDACLRILQLATDDEIKIPVGEYQGMLAAQARSFRRYY